MIQLFTSEQYQSKCEKLFELYKEKILTHLPNAHIEHIGASSISGAISKGDLDIYVAVEQTQFAQAIYKIIEIGFHEKLNTLRTHDLCMLESNQADDVAIQLVEYNSKWDIFIIFRDRLRQSKELVEQYNLLKQQFSSCDMQTYREQKSRFIEQVLTLSI